MEIMQRSNAEWLTALQESGRDQQLALADLRARLLAAIRAYLAKGYATQESTRSDEAQHLAEDCAQEAILIIQSKLGDFRGESRFMTWAYSIAIRVVLGELRRRRWREATIERAQLGQTLPAWPIQEPGPERSLQQREAWTLLARLIGAKLTPLQRTALVAHAFQGMPLDEVAEWLGSNRNNLYKLIHDARKRLKQALLEEGVTHKDLIAVFDEPKSGTHLHSEGKTSSVQRIL
ncbi:MULTISPECIES: sigma-70 family RNA polymerase sigma factor [Methylocystis]|jgi:RNA polymerase sigma-70 factor (ECF subfamily)|uniref:RNA polymerase sigma factor n=1 Tax=Methylocystis TaxID=133 RepID=UPI0013948BB0|nr:MULTISPECIES: sigma-70 family RNA polymerase sigma factor [Methylocystis]KAF0135933.1 MAG: RNA polymerase sigma-24 subunit ECF subfamily [Methylocystaceae bacterium]